MPLSHALDVATTRSAASQSIPTSASYCEGEDDAGSSDRTLGGIVAVVWVMGVIALIAGAAWAFGWI
jgi:hypothetical protein